MGQFMHRDLLITLRQSSCYKLIKSRVIFKIRSLADF